MKTYVLKSDGPAPSFRIDYARELNPQQLAVVEAPPGPMLVIAGAGSGKTRTITYRVARLIESGASPDQICLVTFTNKAAREMMGRVTSLVQADIRHLWGGTFHHLGHRILRSQAKRAGIDPSFTILDREDSADLLDECAMSCGYAGKGKRFPKGSVLIEMISFGQNTGRSLAQVIESRDHATQEIGEQIIRVANAYAARKEERALLDFDDLLVKWRDLLEQHEEVRDYYARTLRHILVDEYQDTNALQGRIVDLLAGAHRNVLVVGDDAQSIYAFRGAHFENIMQFPKKYPEARTFRLEKNYRSVPEILALANASIRGNEKQFKKTLRPERPAGKKPAVVSTNDLAQQAQFVTQRVRELHDGGTGWSEMAVLYRAHYNSMELQMELTRHGIPFVVRSGIRFFEQAHIKDALAFLRIVMNPKDELSWKRVVRLYPKVGEVTAQKIWAVVGRSDDPLGAARSEAARKAVPKAALVGWTKFTTLLESLRAPEVLNRPGDQIRLVLKQGYADYLAERYPNAETRVEDLEQLALFAEPYSETAVFLSEVTLQSTSATESTTIDGAAGQDSLVLSTIHQAKGLEWKAVFIIGLVDGKFPDGRSVSERDKLEEERRLFYVACTRAKDLLTLCYPLLMREQKWDAVQRRSRFIDELDIALYEEWSVATESGWGDEADGDGFDDLRGRKGSRRGWVEDGGGDIPLEDMEDV